MDLVGRAVNRGTVEFATLEPGRTKVNVTIDYEPEGLAEWVGSTLKVADVMVGADLDRFKALVEERVDERLTPTGEWDGRIEGGRVVERDTHRR